MVGAESEEFQVGRRAYDNRLVAIENRLYEMAQEVSALRTTAESMERAVSGNGQPGMVQDLAAYKSRIDERITKLERSKWWLSGALFVSWAIFGAYLKWFAAQ